MKYKFVRTFVNRTNLAEYLKHSDIECHSSAVNEALVRHYTKEQDVTLHVFYRFERSDNGYMRTLCKIKCPINPLPVRGEFEIPNMAVLKRFLLAAGWMEHNHIMLTDAE